ncbi:HAD superfamily hydrolase (TIGR01509 family) [Paraburkholderia sp. GAS199]|uniref:HAD family hydrolase n=1 Tax=Paraburkholderia sp. GAS199 TaxID=3035126 RepID=UPI003D1C1D40
MHAISPPSIEAILWDMDGTLADSEALHFGTLRAVLQEHGIEAHDDLHAATVGRSGRDVHRYCCEYFHRDFDYEEWARFRAAHYMASVGSLKARSGAVEVCRAAASAGIAQAVVSNAGRTILDAGLNALGLLDCVRVTVSANDVHRAKPDPEPYLLAASLLGVAPRHAVVVEDSPTGAQAGIAAGMRVLAWPNGELVTGQFPATARIVTDVAGLAALLGLRV